MKNFDGPFGRMVAQQRRALGMTQERLAELIDRSVIYIHLIEAGKRRPSFQTAQRLADKLFTSVEEREAFRKAARAENRYPTNLPNPLTPLIGRDDLVSNARRKLKLKTVRLLILSGAPGIGKTRLGLEVAHRVVDLFNDGVFLVELAAISDPALVVPAIARVLDLKEISTQPLLETLKTHLHNKQMLLLLDNFDHVISTAPIIAEVLTAAPGLKALITSRAVFRIEGEQEIRVPPLALPSLKHLPPISELAQCAAVGMFVQRAQDRVSDFTLSAANARPVAEICVRLDGLPLAIVLAAARISLFPPQTLLKRLRNRLAELKGGARNLPAHQQTIRGAIDWSYNLLDKSEQVLFARLGMFGGGCILAAAEAVCNANGDLPLEVVDGIAALVDKSLLQQERGLDGESRFTMLETIREYAVERLNQREEVEAVQHIHAAYYLDLVESANPALDGPEAKKWLDHLESEYDNLRAVLDWARNQSDAAILPRLCVALGAFWEVRGYLSIGRSWMEDALAVVNDPVLRASLLQRAGALAHDQADYEQATALYEKSLALAQSIGDMKRVAGALNDLGVAAQVQGNLKRATELYEESLALSQAADDRAGIATSLSHLGNIAHIRGDYKQATELFNESLSMRQTLGATRGMAWAKANRGIVACDRGDYEQAVVLFTESLILFQELDDDIGIATSATRFARVARYQGETQRARKLLDDGLIMLRDLGDKSGIAKALIFAGDVARDLGELDRAATAYNESLVLFREMQNKYGIAWSASNVGDIALDKDDASSAAAWYKESLLLRQEMGDKSGIAYMLEGFAGVAAIRQQPERAARLFGTAEALRESIGAKLAPPERVIYDSYVKRAREQSPAAIFDSAWAAGRDMPLDEAISYALKDDYMALQR